MFKFRKPTTRRRRQAAGHSKGCATAEIITVDVARRSGTATVDLALLVDALLALAEHQNELIEAGEILTDDEGGFAASLACWRAVLAEDESRVADMLGALLAFGCNDIAERVSAELGVGGDPSFARRRDAAEAEHRGRLHAHARVSVAAVAGSPTMQSVSGTSFPDRVRNAGLN